jgi:hypothetical protein
MLQLDLKCIIIENVSFMGRVEIMSEQMELLKSKLEKLVAVTDSLIDSEVVSLSQELDKLISQYYLGQIEI